MKESWRAKIYRWGYPFYKIYRVIFRPRNIGACCVIEYHGKLLLIRNTYGDKSWNFPGGGVKKNENPADAAIREASEEVGIKPKSITSIGELWFDANRYNDTIHAFSAVVEGDKFVIDPGEISEARWFSKDGIPVENLSAVGKKIFEVFLKSKNHHQ